MSVYIRHRFAFSLLLLVFQASLLAQQPSFQVRLDSQQQFSFFQDILVNESDEILMVMLQVSSSPTKHLLVPINGQEGSVAGWEFHYVPSIQQSLGVLFDAYYSSNNVYLLTGSIGNDLISGLNLSTGETWSKEVGGTGSMTTDAEGNAVLALEGVNSSSNGTPRSIGIYKIGPTGNLLMKKGLVLDKPDLLHIQNTIKIIDSKTDQDNNLYIMGSFYTHDTSVSDFQIPGPYFLIKLDSLGNPLKWRIIQDHAFYELYLTEDGVYLLDKLLGPLLYSYTFDQTSAKLVKLDHNLNLQWGKAYRGENFNYLTASVAQTSSGKLVMAHTTFGAFPVVLTELDGSGNIVSQNGYPNFEPQLRVLSDGSLLLCSASDAVGGLFERPVIAKTDTLGNIEGCPTFPTCLFATDFSIMTDDFQISTIEAFDLDTTESILGPITASFSHYCDYPPVPVPAFTFPDSLCLGDSATTISDGNRLAQAREWHLTGPNGIDTLLRDSFEFSYQFNMPGGYILQQAVWVLGCRYDYERSITVLPLLNVAITTDPLICPDEPQEISAIADRNATYAWSDPTGASGMVGATLPVNMSGTYAVTATNGGCIAADTASVTVVAELLGGSPPFLLPSDTNICNVDLPFLLVPQSAFANVFTLGNDPVPAASFPLEAAGVYQVGMETFGCEFQKTFRLAADCHANVYVPNSFSPNGDGFNDVFQPYGNDFEVQELSVYDRWGGLLHQSKGLAGGWDGGDAVQGVYTYRLFYHDLLSLEQEILEGDVVLVR